MPSFSVCITCTYSFYNNNRTKRKWEGTGDDTNLNVAQLVQQVNTLRLEKKCLESQVENFERDKDTRDVAELKTALYASEMREKEEARLSNKIKGLKAILEHRNKIIADLEQRVEISSEED